jgi:hypothetical protein
MQQQHQQQQRQWPGLHSMLMQCSYLLPLPWAVSPPGLQLGGDGRVAGGGREAVRLTTTQQQCNSSSCS